MTKILPSPMGRGHYRIPQDTASHKLHAVTVPKGSPVLPSREFALLSLPENGKNP